MEPHWFVRAYYEQQFQHYRAAWELYIKFYTVFLGANVAALALVSEHLTGNRRWPVVVAFVAGDVVAGVTSVLMRRFSRSVHADIQQLSRAVMNSTDEAPAIVDVVIRPQLHSELTDFACISNALGSAALVACWLGTWIMR